MRARRRGRCTHARHAARATPCCHRNVPHFFQTCTFAVTVFSQSSKVHIAVISDLHLGAGGRADGFGHDDSDFLRFLDFLEGNFERIVLLGDIWETLTSPIPWRVRASLLEARATHYEIAKRFEQPSYTYIHGNHDLIAGVVDRAPDRWVLPVDGKRIVFTHGHHHDGFLCMARHLVELGVCVGGWLRRMGLRYLYEMFEALEQRRACLGLDPRSSFQRWAVGVAERAESDIVVTGHTHVARVSEHGPRLYLNSGSCSNGRFSYLAMDTRTDSYRVCDSW
jgi:predicted phosphodiesterase